MKILALILIISLSFELRVSQTQNVAEVFINFREWDGSRYDHDGDVCDIAIGKNDRCDPYFKIYVSKISSNGSSSLIYNRKTGKMQNSYNVKTFRNLQPLKLVMKDKYEGKIKVTIKVYDHDSASSDDFIDAFYLTYEIPPDNIKRNNTIIGSYYSRTYGKFKLISWAKCSESYYGKNCTKYCFKNDDDHFDCEKKTGEKLCHNGWKGPDCKEKTFVKKDLKILLSLWFPALGKTN